MLCLSSVDGKFSPLAGMNSHPSKLFTDKKPGLRKLYCFDPEALAAHVKKIIVYRCRKIKEAKKNVIEGTRFIDIHNASLVTGIKQINLALLRY